jgi:hypothetical protein
MGLEAKRRWGPSAFDAACSHHVGVVHAEVVHGEGVHAGEIPVDGIYRHAARARGDFEHAATERCERAVLAMVRWSGARRRHQMPDFRFVRAH